MIVFTEIITMPESVPLVVLNVTLVLMEILVPLVNFTIYITDNVLKLAQNPIIPKTMFVINVLIIQFVKNVPMVILVKNVDQDTIYIMVNV